MPDKFSDQEQAFLFAHCLCGKEAREQEVRKNFIEKLKQK